MIKKIVGRIFYLLTRWSRVLIEKLTSLQLVKKFPAFYGARRFITAFTSDGHLSVLSQLNTVHTPIAYFLRIHLNIILSSTPGSPQWTLSLRIPRISVPYKNYIIYSFLRVLF
jgi:hypothetical protein